MRDGTLARVVATIGGPGFGAAVMAALAGAAGADMCSAFALPPGGARPEVLLAESRTPDRSPFALVASLRYARQHWRHDTETLYNLGRAHRSVLTARRSAGSIRDIDYRLECYGAGEVGERLSICRAGDTGLILNAYRDAGAGHFDAAARDWLEDAAELLIAAVGRHRELSRPAGDDAPARLLALGAGLSLREAQVLAAAAEGATQQESAAALGLKPTSIATYRRRGYAKLGVKGRAALRALLAP